MEIKIVGPGCKNCQKLKENVETAVSELGMTPTITKVEDMAEIVKAGVMKTPGLIIDDKLVVSGKLQNQRKLNSYCKKFERYHLYKNHWMFRDIRKKYKIIL